jgi:predicted RNase H-like HicB family nuclease
MRSYVFRVLVEEDAFAEGERAYHAFCPAVKGCHTWGRSFDEALANIREAVELFVEDLRAAGEPIPHDPEEGAMMWPSASVAVDV